jgi:hypothetical protein
MKTKFSPLPRVATLFSGKKKIEKKQEYEQHQSRANTKQQPNAAATQQLRQRSKTPVRENRAYVLRRDASPAKTHAHRDGSIVEYYQSPTPIIATTMHTTTTTPSSSSLLSRQKQRIVNMFGSFRRTPTSANSSASSHVKASFKHRRSGARK